MSHLSRVRLFKKPKQLILFSVAVLFLVITALIDWSLWTWIGLAGIACVVAGWKMKR